LDNQKKKNLQRSSSARMLVNLVCCLAAVLGIPANLFVLIAIFYFRDMRTISNIYIGNLAVADLLFLAGTPIVITQSITRDWNFGSVVCKGFVTGNGISQFASAMFIAVLSLDRFLAVCRPTRASVLRTRRAAIAAVVFAWAIVILEITPLFMFVKLIKSSSSITLLVFSSQITNKLNNLFRFFTTYTFTLSYLLPLIAIWIFYAKIIRKLWQRRHRMHLKRKMSKRKTTKVTIMGLSIVISYTLCWLPYWLIQWSIALNIGNLSILTCASYAAFALLYINRAVNPFIYVFLSESFKRNVITLSRNEKKISQIPSTRCRHTVRR
uniref:G_PROTEIN_RECEP_F1_2 domain-containing protein n=1 Tax=Haemonchus placei TaxID=6290 RepID=A0A0N4WAJ2_HAEPC